MSSPWWRFINSGSADGPHNMAVDEAVLRLYGQGLVPPTLRVYRWRPACLSLGYFQSIPRDVDVERCRKFGIALVRRPTGGRAVLHEEELTYSPVGSVDDPRISGGVRESYRKISQALVAALERLGLSATLGEGAAPRIGGGRSAACFDALGAYELSIRGRKVAGGAQMRRDGILLHQGSLLLGDHSQRLYTLLKTSPEDATGGKQAIGIAEALGREVTWEQVAAAIRAGFEAALGIVLDDGFLTQEEAALAEELVQEKYGTAGWNLLR